ncbi:MAG: DUF4352 domain-containing protein [Thermoprotei archaeon]|nr:MAG: DUF4352 domain-containing protein [Thermoprotei archaeon]
MKAISPVIATVIIVAVAIAIAVAVAFWMTGITGTFTRYEKLEITTAYATGDQTSGWTVTLKVKNTGPSDATIDDIYINGMPLTEYTNTVTSVSYTCGTPTTTNVIGPTASISIPVKSGETATIVLSIAGDTFTSGQTIEIKLHTAAGYEYPRQITLP